MVRGHILSDMATGFDALTAEIRELGGTPRERLAWLVDFASRPRDEVAGQGWRERFGQLTFFVRLASGNHFTAPPPMRVKVGPLTRRARLRISRRLQAGGALHPVDSTKARKELRAAHAKVGAVLLAIASGESQQVAGTANVEAIYRQRPERRWRWVQTTAFHSMADAAAVTTLWLVATTPPRILRRCRYPDCQAVFLQDRRRLYCEEHAVLVRRERNRKLEAARYRRKHPGVQRRKRADGSGRSGQIRR
jgi:hypothetical protein